MLIIIFYATAAATLIISIICTQLNLGHLAPCSWEPVVISLNCLLNSTNETLLFDRFLIMYNLCVFTGIIFIFVFHCTHVRMSYVLNSYLLTYLLTYCWQSNVLGQEITQPFRWPLFCHRRANAVEQSAWTASATGHHLWTVQTIVENVYVWLVGPRRLVSER